MPTKPFTFICGDDDYLIAEQGKAWFAKEAEGLDDLSREIIDGRAGNIDEVANAVHQFTGAVQNLGLFGGRKVVWLRNVSFLANDQTGNAKGTLDLLENLKAVLEQVDPANVGVLVTAHPVNKVRSFYKWISKKADFKLIEAGKNSGLSFAALVQNTCAETGATITPEAIPLLIAKVGGNARLIVEESRKLATFVGDSGDPIDEKLVTELVPNFGEADFFEAADAFYSLKLDWTLEALKRHFFNNSEARPLLASLQKRNRLLIQLRVLLDAGAIRLGARGISKSELDAAARTYGRHFGDSEEKSDLNVFTQNTWYLGQLAETAHRVSLKKLIDFQIAFSDAFEGIIDRHNAQHEVCRELAVRCLG